MTLTDILAAQRSAALADLPVSAATRKDRLRRAATMIRDHADRFCAAMSEDFGHRSPYQSTISDIAGSIAPMAYALKHVDRWMRREKRALELPLVLMGARAWIEYQPKGVVGVIAPWNFPVSLVMGPVAGAFAAGNRVMVKTSEFTPATAALFEDLAPRYFAQDELAFVSGDADVGRAFAALPFDHLLFTGATGIGRHILHAAADNLTPVTLELGGKSPAIIGKGTGLARATERIAIGKMLNAGQICLAPDYVLVPEAQEQAVVDGLTKAVGTLYPTLVDNPDYTAIINDRHHQRLTDWIEDARAKGARVEVVNPANESFATANGRKMPLHLIRDATDDMIVMQEEIFGPILPIVRYDRIDTAIDRINRGARPLGLYHFGSDADERRQVLDRTVSGGVTLDDVVYHVVMEDLPFGGIGPSGMGSYHGIHGFRTFSHAKSVFRQARFDVAKIGGIKPPYGKSMSALLKRQIQF